MKKFIKILAIIVFLILIGTWVGKLVEERTLSAIGVLDIEGAITNSDSALELIRDYEDDDTVKAILIRINSPGGMVGPSQEIYEALLRLKGKKPLVASMCAVGASGAYYIACAADKIYALPGTMTGSIGVLIEFVDLSEGMHKLGIKAGSITSGALKDAGSPFKPMSEQERAYFKGIVMDTQEQFVEAVAKGRKIPLETARTIADGRVYTGRQAQKIKLVDKLGGYDEALEETKRLAGIHGEARIIRPAEGSGLFEFLGKFLDNHSNVALQGSISPARTVRLEYRMF